MSNDRRLTAIALVFAVSFSNSVAAADEPERQSLGRSLEKLTEKRSLKICYFGGSISAADAADGSTGTSWRAATTAWFKEQVPDASIKEVNAALAGTGSDYAAFRCQTDVLRPDPDLVFIEFTADDGNADELRVTRSIEGAVRQILTTNPWAEIVFLYTTTKELSPSYAAGKVPAAVAAQQSIAAHYGLPGIDIGRAMTDRVSSGAAAWDSLTTDGQLLTSTGSALVADLIREYLESHRNDAVAPPVLLLPEPLVRDPFAGAFLADATKEAAPGWEKVNQPLGDRYPRFASSNSPGAEMTYTFSGTTIGLLWLIAPDGGDIEWSIDGGTPRPLSSRSRAAPETGRAEHRILRDDLPSGSHTLRIKVLQPPPGTPEATIRLGAFLVHCDC